MKMEEQIVDLLLEQNALLRKQISLLKSIYINTKGAEGHSPTIKKVESTGSQFIGSTSSYLLTGITFGTEFAVKVTGGLAVALAICFPLVAVESAAESDYRASSECIGRVGARAWGEFFEGKSWGKDVYLKTAKWRCPQLDHVGEALQRVASCYVDNQQRDQAVKQLLAIEDDPIYQRCLSPKLLSSIIDDRKQYQMEEDYR